MFWGVQPITHNTIPNIHYMYVNDMNILKVEGVMKEDAVSFKSVGEVQFV